MPVSTTVPGTQLPDLSWFVPVCLEEACGVVAVDGGAVALL